MSVRQRWLSALRCHQVDRLPFWPKFDASYAPYQTGRFHTMGLSELHKWVGSDRHLGGPSCVRSHRKKTRIEQDARSGVRTTRYFTPSGVLTGIDRYDPISHAWHPREYPVKTPRDIEAMRWVAADVAYELDPDALEEAKKLITETGEDGIVTTSLGISPLMDWIQHLAGIENGLLFLMDHRERVESVFDAMHRGLCRKAEIIASETRYPVVYSVENTSTTLISPDLFGRYCVEHLQDYGRIIRESDKLHVLHMCGKLAELLPSIDALPAHAIEAFTSPPVGSTTLADGRTGCRDKCLIGGTNATLWLERPSTIIAALERDLGMLPHHRGVVISSAGVMPPPCPPETIKTVAEWVNAFPVAA